MPANLFAHIIPGFQHSLLGIDIMCDKDCRVLFTKRRVVIYDKRSKPFLTGWRELTGSKLWHISLRPEMDDVEPCPPNNVNPLQETTLEAYSVYDLPSVEALVRYFHAAAGYPVKDTWLKAIKVGNYASWPGLTLANATKYCPSWIIRSRATWSKLVATYDRRGSV